MANDVVRCKCGSSLFQRTRSVVIVNLRDAIDAAKKARSNAVASKEQKQCPTMKQLALYAVDAVLVYEARSIEEHVDKCDHCRNEVLFFIKPLLGIEFSSRGYFVYEPYADSHEEDAVVCTKCRTRYRANRCLFSEE